MTLYVSSQCCCSRHGGKHPPLLHVRPTALHVFHALAVASGPLLGHLAMGVFVTREHVRHNKSNAVTSHVPPQVLANRICSYARSLNQVVLCDL
jgi:hypothetical protein